MIIKDVPKNSSQNINPLTVEDLKKTLDQSTLQEKLCNNPILVSVDELEKVVTDLTRDQVNTQEPPSVISTATSGQHTVQTSIDTSAKVDTTIKVMMIEHKTQTTKEREPTKEQIGQMDAFVPTTQI